MDFILLFFIFIALELFESNWQKSDSLYGLINNNYLLFRKNIFIYFILHISFFYTIFLSFYFHNFAFWMSSIFIVKFADISFKLSIMKKLSNGISVENIVPMNLNIIPIIRYFNVLFYPLIFLFAIKLI
ncbi:MAG: hypothetical protein PHE16_10415 [Aliarcobacter sp.]|nr:hypothetical protein [Aliarcobacter sp.]